MTDTREPGTAEQKAERAEALLTEYLSLGGLWNPELMEPAKVRDMVLDCREALSQLRAAPQCIGAV